MQYKNFDYDFVERTKNIIETHTKDDFKYDVTLLLNCLCGLVSLPIERTSRSDTIFQKACVDKLKDMDVIEFSTSDTKTFRTVKNALSHINICAESKHGIIDSLILVDKNCRSGEIHTELHFTVKQLKEFALFVADKHLERSGIDGAA